MTADPSAVRLFGPDALSGVTEVLCESFYDYPVMRYVLSDCGEMYDRRLRTLIGYFVTARVLRGESLLGSGDPDDPDGVALVSRFDRPSPPALAALREVVWADLGDEARARYEAFGAACAPFLPDEPHLHLNMVGVRNRARGRGLGRHLIEYVHAMSEEDPTSLGVSLSTENPANVSLYGHFGYELTGEAVVSPELTTWSFYRRNPEVKR